MHRVALPTIPFLIAGSAVLFTSCSRTPSVQADTGQSAEIPSIAVAKAGSQDLSHGLVLTAEFKPYQEVDVMAKVAGYVKNIYVDIGDRVKDNQLLAILEIPEMGDDLRRAQAAADRAAADVKRAADDLQRAQSAHDLAHLSYERLKHVVEKKP